jgi:hypothetical protein
MAAHSFGRHQGVGGDQDANSGRNDREQGETQAFEASGGRQWEMSSCCQTCRRTIYTIGPVTAKLGQPL